MIITKMTSAVIMCLISTIGLAIIYFSKRRIDNQENRIYKVLIITNIIGLVLHLTCDIVSYHYEALPTIFSTFILKTFLMYYFTFGSILLVYLLSISKVKNFDIYYSIMPWINVILAIITFFMPQHVVRDFKNMIFYTNGKDVYFIYIMCAIEILALFIIILTKLSSIDKKKMIPLLIFMVGATISVFIQRTYPDIVVTDCFESIIVLLMYFTIENPDIQMIEELNIARERADKANNAKTEFLSSMSHEIRTPLNAIDGFSQLILEENNIDVIKEEAKDIMSASKNLLELVNGILDISKIEANKLEIVNVEYEPTKIFNDVATLAKSRIGSKPVEFKIHIAEDLPDYLLGDYTRIKQITLNLLTNAVKYTKDGYVDFSVRCVKQNGICRLIIMVKDTGIGIKKENVDKLFQKFERFDKEQNITIEGTGLGLAITKKLIDLMHGRIIADSIYGTGSIFAAVIDQKIIDKKKEVTEKEEVNKTSFDGKRILIVDDNKVNLKVASRLLATYNVITEEITSGFECLDKINAGEKFDLILMDDMMPNMSGTETFKKLNQIPYFSIPVIALTANAIAGMKEKYIKEGFNDYISKPIDKKELERVLNKYLN